MRHALFLIGVVVVSHVGLARGGGLVQERPNFSGTWTLDHIAADPRMRTLASPDYFLGTEITVVQDATRLVLTQTRPKAYPSMTFAFDAGASSNTLPNFREGPALTFVSRVLCDRGTLVVATTTPWEMT